ncbi:MAG: hypothetical protein P8Z80_20040 [Pseudolabrys sp.]|jgi:hypothetical protein
MNLVERARAILLHTGIAELMKPPANKTVLCTTVVVVVMIVIWLVIGGAIIFALLGGFMR